MFGMCKADLNQDGILDLAVTNDNTGVSIFNGAVNGTFAAGAIANTGPQPHQVIAADFNNDTKIDLATANFGASNITVLINSGGGVFSQTNVNSGGSGAKSLTSGDFNADGNVDIAVVNAVGNNYSVILGGGNGTFTLSSTTAIGGTPYGICAADLNKDGKLDLATVSNGSGQAQVMIGQGNGTFNTAVTVGPSLNGPFGIVAADWDNDSDLDLLIPEGGSNNVAILLGDGLGGFAGGPGPITASSPRSVATGDFNDDGYMDLVTANYSGGNISLIAGNGGGWSGSFNMGSSSSPRTVVVGDYNNDGLDDIAVTNNGSNMLQIYLNTKPNISLSGPIAYCAGGTTTLTASGASSYTWSTGPTTNTITLNPVSTTTYYVAGSDITCPLKDTLFFSVTVNPLPTLSATANPPTICPGSQMTLNGAGATTYTWSGGVMDGVPFTSPVVTTSYTLSGTDNNGCTNSTVITINPATPSAPNICTVTVDSLSINNVIVWDKTLYPNADTFYVSRDTANNNYVVIGTLPYSALSQYIDTARHMGSVNGDPNITTYHYKLSYKDTCGNMSPLSPYHNSIYQYNIGSLFLWNAYQIEGQSTPVPGLSSYALKRDNLGATGNYVTAASAGASSTSINDPAYATWQTTADWRVETVWNITCVPTQLMGNNGTQGTVVRSKSNITNNRTTGIKTLNKIVSLYPNPTNGNLVVDFGAMVSGKITIKVLSMLGEEVYSADLTSIEYKHNIDLSQNTSGIYLVQLITDSGTISKRVIKQ